MSTVTVRVTYPPLPKKSSQPIQQCNPPSHPTPPKKPWQHHHPSLPSITRVVPVCNLWIQLETADLEPAESILYLPFLVLQSSFTCQNSIHLNAFRCHHAASLVILLPIHLVFKTLVTNFPLTNIWIMFQAKSLIQFQQILKWN